MSRLLALELNDLGLRISGDPVLDEIEPSLGWAVFEPDGITSGSTAAARARLHPRLAHRAIWSELTSEPLPRPFPRGSSTADLAYSHLRELWDESTARLGRRAGDFDGVLLLAPASFSAEQLGLVLGIARSLELPITGIVDAAVAAGAGVGLPAGRSLHVDLELGRAVLTELEAGTTSDGPWTARRRVRIEKLAGWNALLDLWAREVGRGFVSATRYDPLHAARSEQELYDRLPVWLSELSIHDSVEAVMGSADREHRVLLTREQVGGAATSVYDRIVAGARALAQVDPEGPAGSGGALLLSNRVARAPGLVDRLAAAGFDKHTLLEEGAAAAGALANAERLHTPRKGPLPLITRLSTSVAAPRAE